MKNEKKTEKMKKRKKLVKNEKRNNENLTK